tara:strand:- start:3176 stop:3664 length:489 start_codon:yes stop_codon:yes gene_type:complete
MSYIKTTILIFSLLAASRFIPHPPNFTSLLALSFYVPAFLGLKFIPALVLCFLLTDLFIGFHSTAIFTWGSVVLIGLISKYFLKNIYSRLFGALFGASIFFVVTNFGVWTLGSYGYSLEGFILCYTLAIPFFTYSLISTLLFSLIIEGAHSQTKIFFKKYLT